MRPGVVSIRMTIDSILIIDRVEPRLDLGVQRDNSRVQGLLNLTDVCKSHAFSRLIFTLHGEIIQPQTMSCEGTIIGLPFAGLRMLLVDIIRNP